MRVNPMKEGSNPFNIYFKPIKSPIFTTGNGLLLISAMD